MIGSVLNTGLEGVQKGMTGLHQTAQNIASKTTQVTSAPQSGQSPATVQAATDSSLAESMVEMRLYEATTQASAKVVKTADEMIGTLIDTFA